MDWDKAYQAITKRNWIILFLLSLISYFAMPPSATLGVILGGVAIIINFDLLQYTIRRAFPTNGTEKLKKPALIIKSYVRLLGLGMVMYLLIKLGRVDPIGLAIGLSTVVFSIISFGISHAVKIRAGEAI